MIVYHFHKAIKILLTTLEIWIKIIRLTKIFIKCILTHKIVNQCLNKNMDYV